MTTNPRFPFKRAGIGLLTCFAGYEALQLPVEHASLYGAGGIVGGLLVTGGSIAWWARRRESTDAQIGKWSRRSRRGRGTATWVDHQRRTSARSMRRRARHLRPSLAGVSRWQLRRMPMSELSVYLGSAAGRRLYASLEDVVLRIAGTRSGKTTAMAARIIDAPGGVVVTSTRVDLLRTLPLRAQRGPCHVYDPAGISGQGSTIKWSPLDGCRNPAIAAQRGRDMIPFSGSAEGERWDEQARRVLGMLMHAAALADKPMRTVMRWLAADGPSLREVGAEVDQALADSKMAAQMRLVAQQYFSNNDRTRSSIVTTAMPAVAWLTDARASAIGDCAVEESLDLADLFDRNGTLYILGRRDGLTGPLTGALVAELIRRGEVTAELRGGRLDPPLTAVLDEAPKVAPGPLHLWTSDCGGRGILLDIATQSLAAMEETWGPTATRMILGNANVVLVGAGCKDPVDLAHWSDLSGQRHETEETRDKDGKVTSTGQRAVPVLPVAVIAGLEKGQAIVYGAGPVTIIRTPNTWERRDVRRSLRDAVPLPRETNYEDDMILGESKEGDGR